MFPLHRKSLDPVGYIPPHPTSSPFPDSLWSSNRGLGTNRDACQPSMISHAAVPISQKAMQCAAGPRDRRKAPAGSPAYIDEHPP
jgi:hypothetical protein